MLNAPDPRPPSARPGPQAEPVPELPGTIRISVTPDLLRLILRTAQVLCSAREVAPADRRSLIEFIRYAQSRLGNEPEPVRSPYVPR